MRFGLYTDGACQPNPGSGGWAYIVIGTSGLRISNSGFQAKTTNNRMEITAVIEGLKKILSIAPHTSDITADLFSDSRYLLNGLETWMHRWEQHGWIKKDGKPVLNTDLWKDLCHLDSRMNIECHYIPGHSGHTENEECDRLAINAIQAGKNGKS